ncbi:MAG: DNA repair protein RecO [Synergistaceae bacterium]|nr:DNA repair protein RecO [Synergistaceae bacterium]
MISNFGTDKLEQGYYKQSGTVLQRRDSVKSGLSLLLFLRDLGPRWVFAPAGSSKNRFGGAIEPMMWGTYNIYQSPNGLYLQSAEVKEDFLILRSKSLQLYTAIQFYKTVCKVVETTHESNNILNLLWGTMLLLKENCHPKIVEFRFIWRLLNAIGLAPSLRQCVLCGSLLNNSSFWSDDGLCCSKCSTCVSIDIELLKELQYAATLKQNDFLKWSQMDRNVEIYQDFINKLRLFLI